MRHFSFALAGVHVNLAVSRERREHEDFERTNNSYLGDFANWQDAIAHAKGYASAVILDRAIAATRDVVDRKAVFERDTVLFDQPQVAHPLLAGLLYAATVSHNALRVMDFGGALGSSYRQNAPFLAELNELQWGVVEQDDFVKAGKSEFETDVLRFFPDVDTCVAALSPNFLLLSSVLQYLEQPLEFLEYLLLQSIPFVFVDRTMAHRLGRDRLVVQRVPAAIYDASYPAWLMNADRLESAFTQAGYEIVYSFDPHPGSTFGPSDLRAPYIGWFLHKKPQDCL